jgi:release factor glutamine methyltransferase
VKEKLPQYIARLSALLDRAGIEQAVAEIELILCHLTGMDRLRLYLEGESLIDTGMQQKADDIVKRRLTRHPLQYLIGESWFYGSRFGVTPAVMIPTPETELLCRTAIDFAASSGNTCPRLLDVGTGSGVVAVTAAAELPDCRVTAVDLSPVALEVARCNAAAAGVDARIDFRQSDFFSAIHPDERFDLILSNPPYIAEGDYDGLPPEVKAVPKMSLLAGTDGLDAIRVLLDRAPAFLAANGRIMFEIGYSQADAIRTLVHSDRRYGSITIHRDLNELDRVVVLSCE